MRVRQATEADVMGAALVAEASYRGAFAEILEPEALAGRTAENFAVRFAAVLPGLRVAERDGVVVGFSLLTDGHIDMLFIDPAVQGTGAGTLLLAEAEGRGAVSLECFRDNHAARGFYERHGWRVTRGYARELAGRVRDFVFYEKQSGELDIAAARTTP